jgi:YebC/PmpR family DNA-binding regulatory protein
MAKTGVFYKKPKANTMAGHSQFKNIMHRKGAQDAKRGKLFTKLIKEITVAAKQGDPDPSKNPRLRAALAEARGHNMPKDNIDRAIKRASEAGVGDDYVSIRYEGYGPKGAAVIVEALTDNRNRTASEVRAAFSKYNGTLGETGSVSFMFSYVGEIVYPEAIAPFDTMFEAAVEAGAKNLESQDGHYLITTHADDLHQVASALSTHYGDPLHAKRVWVPETLVSLPADDAETLAKLIDVLEDNDDVQTVYTNVNLPSPQGDA